MQNTKNNVKKQSLHNGIPHFKYSIARKHEIIILLLIQKLENMGFCEDVSIVKTVTAPVLSLLYNIREL